MTDVGRAQRSRDVFTGNHPGHDDQSVHNPNKGGDGAGRQPKGEEHAKSVIKGTAYKFFSADKARRFIFRAGGSKNNPRAMRLFKVGEKHWAVGMADGEKLAKAGYDEVSLYRHLGPGKNRT